MKILTLLCISLLGTSAFADQLIIKLSCHPNDQSWGVRVNVVAHAYGTFSAYNLSDLTVYGACSPLSCDQNRVVAIDSASVGTISNKDLSLESLARILPQKELGVGDCYATGVEMQKQQEQ